MAISPSAGILPLPIPLTRTARQVESVFEDFTGYKNRNGGIWARGEMHLFKNLKLADNAIGFTHASGNFGRSAYTSRVVDSLFVGETENIGNPRTPAEMAYGRSLPKPELADFPIRGYEFYDFHHELDNDTFVNYQDNATRKTGAISYLLFTSFGMSTNNTVERAKFVNAKPVYFPPMEHKWSNDDYGKYGLQDCGVQRQGRLHHRGPQFLHRHQHRNRTHRRSLRGQAHLERCRVQGRYRAHECWRRWWCGVVAAALAVLAVVLPEPAVLADRAPRAAVGPGAVPVLAQTCARWRVPAVLVQGPLLVALAPGGGRTGGRRCTCAAASRSQPQWQGVHRQRGNQGRRRYRVSR